MYKKLYQQIKYCKIYIYRYRTTMLIKNIEYIKYLHKKELNNLKSKNKKITHGFKEHKEHSYLPTSKPFLL